MMEIKPLGAGCEVGRSEGVTQRVPTRPLTEPVWGNWILYTGWPKCMEAVAGERSAWLWEDQERPGEETGVSPASHS